MQSHTEPPSKWIVPPNKFTEAPSNLLSPSTKQVEKILRLIQRLHRGKIDLESEWYTFKLRREDYSDLLIQIKQEPSLWRFVEDKLRHDYSSSTEILVLRKTTVLHEYFLARVVEEIQTRLRTFINAEGAEDQSRAFVQNIKHGGSGRLIRKDNNGQIILRRSPDVVFKLYGEPSPSVILEVSYSQEKRELKYLADDYILRTNGNVRVVVGLDIDYSTKKGTLSIWRPEYVLNEQGEPNLRAAQMLSNQIFRDESKKPNLSSGAGLRLDLRDFAPQKLDQDVDGSFLIDSATLCRFLEEAEKEQGRNGANSRS